MKRGISTAKNLAASTACLASTGIDFAFRYYSISSWKRLTLAEANSLSSAGIEIGVVYEDAPVNAAYFTTTRGQKDAQRALQFAQMMDQPPGTAIYFAVDYDAAQQDLPAISNYFGVVRSQMDAAGYILGVYGSGTVCRTLKEDQGLAVFSWLAESTGWSGSHTYSTWDIKQSIAHTPLCGLAAPDGYEDNQAVGDFGGFSLQPIVATQMAAMTFATAAKRKSPAKTAKKKPAAKKKTAAAKKTIGAGKTTTKKKSATASKKAAKKTTPRKNAKKATATKSKTIKAPATKKQSILRMH